MTKSIAQTSSESDDRKASPHRFRWKWGLGILLAGIASQQLQPLIWWKIVPSGTRFALSIMWYVWITAFVLLVWWLFFSGLRWTTRVMGTCAFLLVVIVISRVFRIDGYTGDGIPIVMFRWTPTAQQQADDYWRTHAVPSSSTVDIPAEITELKPFPVTEDDWPRFSGHRRDGMVSSVAIRRDWKQRPPELLWKHPVGVGWSSFAVVSNVVITQEQRGEWECVVCYDFQTGAELWNHKDRTRFSELMGGDGPRATPTVYDNRIYSLGATGILNCLEAATGRRLWSINVLKDGSVSNLLWGMSGAPLIFGDFVIVTPGAQVYGSDGSPATFVPNSAVAAYDRFTGRKIWSQGEAEGSYSSPHLATFNEHPHLLVFNADGLAGHDPQTGTRLWNFAWTNTPRVNVAQPLVITDETLLIGTGYGLGSVLLRIERKGNSWSA
jgi:outer membrane protein assembly factor BamB